MSRAQEAKGSAYMNWAKTSSGAKYNLATSGLANLSLRELEVSLDDLEITNGGYGYAPLKQAISERYRVATDSIVTAAGTSFANHLALAALLEPGEEVLMEQPVYEPVLATARYLGAEVKRFKRSFAEGFRLEPAEVERHLTPRTKLIVVTNLHNPSGVLTDQATMKEIGDLARTANARVLVDEVYLETLFEKEPRTAFQLGPEFVITNSL